MEKNELIQVARKCANFETDVCNECPFKDDGGCADALMLNLAMELENSISKEDLNAALNQFKVNDCYGLTYEQSVVWNAITEASIHRENRDKLLAEHDEYYLTYNGDLFTTREVVASYEKETGKIAYDFHTIKHWFEEWTLCVIPKADMTYSMLIKMGKKIEAIKLYRENNNCPFFKAKDAIEHLEATL